MRYLFTHFLKALLFLKCTNVPQNLLIQFWFLLLWPLCFGFWICSRYKYFYTLKTSQVLICFMISSSVVKLLQVMLHLVCLSPCNMVSLMKSMNSCLHMSLVWMVSWFSVVLYVVIKSFCPQKRFNCNYTILIKVRQIYCTVFSVT